MPKPQGLKVAFAALAAGLLLASCGVEPGSAGNIRPPEGTGPQNPGNNPGGTESPGNGGSSGAAPRVTSPLNPAPILANACDAFSSAQLTALGLQPGKPRQIETGSTCSWKYADDSGNAVNVSPVVPNARGLSDIYDKKEDFAYFEVTQVSGYPAVYAGVVDDRNRGECELNLGITDQLGVFIFTQLEEGPDRSNPCPVASKFGAAMIQNLQQN